MDWALFDTRSLAKAIEEVVGKDKIEQIKEELAFASLHRSFHEGKRILIFDRPFENDVTALKSQFAAGQTYKQNLWDRVLNHPTFSDAKYKDILTITLESLQGAGFTALSFKPLFFNKLSTHTIQGGGWDKKGGRQNLESLKISPLGEKMLHLLEGKINRVYLDQAGKPTFGIGHLIMEGDKHMCDSHKGTPFKLGDPVTEEEIIFFHQQDIKVAENSVKKHLEKENIYLHQFEYDALISFIFNIGAANFLNSSLRKNLISREYEAASTQFQRWIYISVNNSGISSKNPLADLKIRREIETKFFLGKITSEEDLKREYTNAVKKFK